MKKVKKYKHTFVSTGKDSIVDKKAEEFLKWVLETNLVFVISKK
jgi:hypothetical protein